MKQSRHGFTLIELILGLSLLTLVMLTIYNVFWGGLIIRNKANASQEVYKQAYWSLDVMNREIENLVKFTFAESYPEKFCFVGSKNKITFMSPSDKGLKAVSYYLLAEDYGAVHKTIVNYQAYKKNVQVNLKDSTAEPTQLLVRQEIDFGRYVAEDSDAADLDEDDDLEVIAIRVKADGLRFSYGSMGSVEEAESATFSWLDEWESNELPVAVRIELDLVQPGDPEQVIHFEKEALIPTEVWSRLQ